MTNTARLTYYNGVLWRTTLLPRGARAVQPLRREENGSLAAWGKVRNYRPPATA